jgi:hypothetical protein
VLTLDDLARYRVLPDPRWESAVARVFMGLEDRVGVQHRLVDFVPPTAPVLYATNATQKYDFLTFRSTMARRGQRVVTVTKAKNYHVAWMRPVLARTGVIPLASKGYVLLLDASQTLGRPLRSEEYRALRDYLDGRAPQPELPDCARLFTVPRDLFGVAFVPGLVPLRAVWRRAYKTLLGESLRLARTAVAAGWSVHIYPEGTVSPRLGVGRPGAMQFARALGVPVVPVGMSGCPEAYRGTTPMPRGAEVVLRFGAAYTPDLSGLDPDFVPFDPDHEDRARPVLQAATDDLMRRLDALLAPPFQRAPDGVVPPPRDPRRLL